MPRHAANQEAACMKTIAISLIVIGIVGLVFIAVLPALFGISGIVGAVGAILTGIGFLRLNKIYYN